MRFLGALLLLLAAAPEAGAWGFAGHRLVNGQAVRTLPPPLRTLFEGNEAWLREHAIDPDLWVIAGREGELPNHFLNLDTFGAYPFAEVPAAEAEHLARFGAAAAESGRLPWRVADVYRELVAAFMARDPARVLERAAVLGHYVGDAHVPLHAVLNYDGQLSGQKGVHARWESELVDRFERQIEARVEPGAAVRVDDPAALVLDVLRESFARAQETLAADKEVAGPRDFADTPEDDRYDEAYYSRLYEREGESLVSRLDAAATALGSLWLSAWEEAGRPELDADFRFPYVRGETRLVLLRVNAAFDDALGRGQLPQLARLRQRGSAARLDTLPTTGPEPLFLSAARQGLTATALLLPEAHPFAPYLEGKRYGANFGRNLTLIVAEGALSLPAATWSERDPALREPEGWTGSLPAGAREFQVRTGELSLFGLAYDDAEDTAYGLDTVLLAPSRDFAAGVKLKARPPSPGGGAFASVVLPTAAGDLPVSFRLWSFLPDGKSLLLHQPAVHDLLASRPRVASAAGVLTEASDEAYLRGDFGPVLWSGGDGTAEARYLETVANAAHDFGRLFTFGLERTRWQVLMAEAPGPGPAVAEWRRRIDARKDGANLRKLRRVMDQYLLTLDGLVGDLARQIGEDTAVALLTPTSFVLAGPGVASEKNLGSVPAANVAPTLTTLLGLEAATTEGEPLRAALPRLPSAPPPRGPKQTQHVGDPTRSAPSRASSGPEGPASPAARLLHLRPDVEFLQQPLAPGGLSGWIGRYLEPPPASAGRPRRH